MSAHADKTPPGKDHGAANTLGQRDKTAAAASFADNRPEAIAQRKLQAIVNQSAQVKQLKAMQALTGKSAIQRFPEAMDDDSAKALGSFYSVEHQGKKDEDYTEDELTAIKSGVFMLTSLSPRGMAANCIGWAQGSDSIEETGSIYTWEQAYTGTEEDADDAKIILWGEKKEGDEANESKWDIRHASVLLTHAEIAARSRNFAGFTPITTQALAAAGISNPCWTSVGGFGYGAIVHPKYWLEGGDFGTALKGMK